MTELIGRTIEAFKSIFPFLQRHLLAIALFMATLGWILILLPQQVSSALHIENLRTTQLEAIGALTFLFTFGFCFGVAYKGYVYLHVRRTSREDVLQKEKKLYKLTPVECKYLQKYIESQSQTATFSLYDGVAAGLVEKEILCKANSQSNKAGEQDFNLYPWAYEFLSTHQEILIKGVKSEGQR